MQLLILDAITKNLKPSEYKFPPVLTKGMIADTMDTLNCRLKENSIYQSNFNNDLPIIYIFENDIQNDLL